MEVHKHVHKKILGMSTIFARLLLLFWKQVDDKEEEQKKIFF